MKTEEHHILLILTALGLAAAPHALRLPVWVTLWCALFWGYRAGAVKRGWSLPSNSLRLVLTIAGILLVALSAGLSFNREAAVALLVIMMSLKAFEINTHRDRMVTLFLGFFLIITSLLFSSSLAMTVYMLAAVLVLSAVMIHINHPVGRFAGDLRLSARIIGLSLPMMLFLFFLFPRIQGSLWGFTQAGSAVTGFSDQLQPGSVSQLVRNSDIAFRVEFQGEPPAPDQLYWRGLVFSVFDGQSWHIIKRREMTAIQISGEKRIEYTIRLEANQRRWLFALDVPVATDARALLSTDHTLTAFFPVRQPVTYRVISVSPETRLPPYGFSPVELQVPAAGNRRAKELARRWRSKLKRPELIIEQGLAYFRKNGFFYTLNPPLLGEDPIDRFLFETRRGYCEHYAAAFTFLMRSAGIPARIVGGYLGGEMNPYGDYMIVRQSDAHAWVEVWLDGRGWVRIDPTSVVAPQRITQGMLAAIPIEERPVIFTNPFLNRAGFYVRRLMLGWDALNNFWQRQVIGYSFLDQKTLLQNLGLQIDSWYQYLKIFILLLILAGGAALLIALGILRKTASPKDRLLKAYQQYCQKLARIGIPRAPSQGPLDHALVVSQKRPDLKKEVEQITTLYIDLRYANKASPAQQKTLSHLIKQFHPASDQSA